jgi:hypothetical protein
LRDTAEARALAFGHAGEPSGLAVTAHLDSFGHPPRATGTAPTTPASSKAIWLTRPSRPTNAAWNGFSSTWFLFGCFSPTPWWPHLGSRWAGLHPWPGRSVIHASE